MAAFIAFLRQAGLREHGGEHYKSLSCFIINKKQASGSKHLSYSIYIIHIVINNIFLISLDFNAV